MQYRTLGRTGFRVSEISFGAWAIGGSWGAVNDRDSIAALNRSIDLGVNFIDTADVYGDGRSERLVSEVIHSRSQRVYVATKLGRRLSPHVADGYNKANMTAFIERSLKNLQVEALDLVQLHCPPTEVYSRPEVFATLDDLQKEGKIRNYGVSVERVSEAMTAIRYPGVQTVQIIFNMFRLKPAEEFFQAAKEAQVGILARVPLASGLLTGKMRPDYQFAPDDHRQFNRHGEAFDKGETFSGVPYELGLKLVEELRPMVPPGATMAQWALRWILMFDAVTCAIPGAKNPKQAEDNVGAAALPALSESDMARIRSIYDQNLRQIIHPNW